MNDTVAKLLHQYPRTNIECAQTNLKLEPTSLNACSGLPQCPKALVQIKAKGPLRFLSKGTKQL